MEQITKKCREVIDRTEWVAIATSGEDGPHIAATWGDYVRAFGIIDDALIIAPAGGYSHTERNLKINDKIELLMASRQVEGSNGPGKGCKISGRGEIQSSGENFDLVKTKFPWARGVLVVRIEQVTEQL